MCLWKRSTVSFRHSVVARVHIFRGRRKHGEMQRLEHVFTQRKLSKLKPTVNLRNCLRQQRSKNDWTLGLRNRRCSFLPLGMEQSMTIQWDTRVAAKKKTIACTVDCKLRTLRSNLCSTGREAAWSVIQLGALVSVKAPLVLASAPWGNLNHLR